MSGPKPSANSDAPQPITVLLVDDNPETRENIKKLLAFEADIKVIGTAGTGREGVAQAKEHKPDIIIMDINMPDMDGLEATSAINKSVPQSAVIIMSVQDETDYMRRAMLAGARDFIAKPVSMDDLITTIRTVYRNHEAFRRQYQMAAFSTPEQALRQATKLEGAQGERAGRIIVVYSPQGGTGVTTLATSLATLLMTKGVRVLMADADLQFGDVTTVFDIKAQATILELLPDADDIDPEHFDNIIPTHGSGLKVLASPHKPEQAEEITKNRPGVYRQILEKVRHNYDYIVIDMAHAIDELAASLFEVADQIVMVATPALPSIKNARFALDLMDRLGIAPDKISVVLNKVYSDRDRKNATLPTDRIQSFLKRQIRLEIPVVDERMLLGAVLRGVPLTIAERDRSKPPLKQFAELSKQLVDMMTASEEDAPAVPSADPKKPQGGGLFRRS
ncbi:MAG: response regulator [Anaerolineae bacterium]|nr:response regulator [Anaerolineae bacterium]